MTKKHLIDASNGRKIPTLVIHPDNIDLKSRDNILIFFLHGIGENSNSKDDMAWLDYYRNGGPQVLFKLAQESYKGKNFILIAPQLSKWDAGMVTAETRNGTWPTWYLDTVYEWAMRTFPNDPQRCALTGLSYGGGGLINYVTSNSMRGGKMFSSIFSVCGVNGINNGYEHVKNVPIVFYHAQDDHTVGVSESTRAVEMINRLNPVIKPILITPEFGGHGIWDAAYSRSSIFWDFILDNKFIQIINIGGGSLGSADQKPGGLYAPIDEIKKPEEVLVAPPPIVPPAKKSGVKNMAPARLSFATGAKEIILDASASQGGKGWWDILSKPQGAWLVQSGPISKLMNMKDGKWLARFTDMDDYGKIEAKDVIVEIGQEVKPKQLLHYEMVSVFDDGSRSSLTIVPQDKIKWL